MKYLSVCSGIEAASCAWHPLGWEAVAFAEIEPFPCRVLKHHFPDVPNLGNMTKIDGDDFCGAVDLLVGGTPCQDFSVAGKRAGLDGERSGLARHFIRLLNEIYPKYFIWENVPGCLHIHHEQGRRWFKDDEILPYSGNEHLLGTTDSPTPKWEPKPGELVAVRYSRSAEWVARIFNMKDPMDPEFPFLCFKEQSGEKTGWRYCEPLRKHFTIPEE